MRIGTLLRAVGRAVGTAVRNLVSVVTEVMTHVNEATEWATQTEEGQSTIEKLVVSVQLLNEAGTSIVRQVLRQVRRRPSWRPQPS